MKDIGERVLDVLKFIAVSLLIDVGLFILVTVSCQLGTRCTNVQWSERMFWVAMVALLAAMPAVLASMSTGRGYFDNPMTAGADMQIAGDIIKQERKELSGRTVYMFRMITVGMGGILFSALIDILTR